MNLYADEGIYVVQSSEHISEFEASKRSHDIMISQKRNRLFLKMEWHCHFLNEKVSCIHENVYVVQSPPRSTNLLSRIVEQAMNVLLASSCIG